MKKIVKKTTRFLRQLPRWTWLILAGLIAITLLIKAISPAATNWINTPRDLKLKNAKRSSNYIYTAGNKELDIFLGEKNSNLPTVTLKNKEDSLISFTLAQTNPDLAEPIREDNLVTFKNVRQGVDLVYQTLPNGIKEEIILTQKGQGNSFAFDTQINKANPKMMTSEFFGPTFYDQDDNYLFHFEKPFAVDAAGNRTDDVILNIRRQAKDGNQYKIIITVPLEWLNSPNRVYPISIDPTVIHDLSSEFSPGQLNRNKDTGSGSLPSIETYYQELPADEHTVGLWHMNEASGNVLDSSGNDNTGTPTGTTVVDGKLNNGRSFNGTSDYIDMGDVDIIDGATQATISVWVNPDTLPGAGTDYNSIVSKHDGTAAGNSYFIRLEPSDSGRIVRAQFGDGSVTMSCDTTETPPINTWTLLTAVLDADDNCYLYFNDRMVAQNSNSSFTGINSTAYTLKLGYSDYANETYFDGLIDEVRISNTARSAEEIKAAASRRPYSVYTSDVIDLTTVESWTDLAWDEWGVATGDGETLYSSTDLVAQWNFNETSGTTADNAEGTAALDGTLSGFDSTTSQDADPDSSWTANNKRWGAGGLMFDGADSYTYCTDANCGGTSALDIGSNNWSISSWIKTNKATRQNIAAKGSSTGQYSYALESGALSDGTADFYLFNTVDGSYMNAHSTIAINDGKWHYLVGTYDGTTIKLYIDGQLDNSSSSSTGTQVTDSTGNFDIGSRGGSSLWFDGTIDSTRIYSRALPAHEILSNYNATNINFQTRVGADTSPDDGSWAAWTPTTGETALESFDSSESTNWGYRKSITITHTGTAVTEYQVLIDNLDTAALITADKLQPDCGDLRFTNSSGELLPYSLVGNTCNTTTTKIWLQTDSIPASGGATIYMFYGNPAAANYSNESDTFGYSSEKDIGYTLDAGTNDLQVISLEPNNSISHNGTTLTLSQYETGSFTSISSFSPISATKMFNAEDTSDDTDLFVPVSWAGTEFYFYTRDGAITLDMLSPWGTATVTAYEGGAAISGCTSLTITSTGSNTSCTGAGADVIRVSSDIPILLFVSGYNGGAGGDEMPVHPATTQKWIGGGGGSIVNNGNASLDYRFYESTNASEQNLTDAIANTFNSTITGDANYGGGASLIWSEDSTTYGVHQYGDGDGGDSHYFNDETEQGTRFGSANIADYISIASTQPATCSIYEEDGTLKTTTTLTSSNTKIYHSLIDGNTTAYTTAGWYMTCDLPVVAHYQKSTVSEANLMHYPMMRQFTYPTPSVGTPGTESTQASHTGSWIEMSADNLETVSLTSDTTLELEGTATEKIITGSPQINSNTYGLWHLEETSGTGAYLDDETSYGHDVTPSGTTIVNGISGKARDFDGTDDYIQLLTDAQADALGTTFSISAWFKSEDTAGEADARIFGRDCSDYYCTYVNQSAAFPQDLVVVIDDATAAITYTGVIDAGWNHIVMTWDNTTVRTYLNGKLLGSNSFTGFLATDRPIVIGDNTEEAPSPGSSPFDGVIDEITIFDNKITANDVADIYRMGRDRYLNKTITSTDLSGKDSLPFYIAADRTGTYIDTTVGESAYANYLPDANTVGLWHLAEEYGSGDYLEDSSGSSNHGDPTGTTFTEGKIGKGRSFDGTSDYVDAGNDSSLPQSGDITIESWFKTSDTGNILQLTSFGTTNNWLYGIGKDATDQMSCKFYQENIGTAYLLAVDSTSTTTINDSNWHHVACVLSGTTLSIYVDGKFARSDTTTAGTRDTSTTGNFYIGKFDWSTTYNWDGEIDEVRISDTARTASEIRQAYEVGLRTHPITIDFAATGDSGNLISSSGDYSFTVDATAYGLNEKGSNIYLGDKIIVRENYDGTEYIAQGTVTAVTPSTGAITVVSWDSGSTFPSGGYTANADFFKWQREYWPIADNTLSTHMDAITNLTLRLTNGSEGRTIWLDDLKSTSGYLTDKSSSTITSATGNQYFQYRAILTSLDEAVSATLSAVTLDYVENVAPTLPSLDVPIDTATNQALLPILKTTTTDVDSDYLRYKIELCENVGMSTNCQTFDQTSSQTGWSGQNTETSTAYTSGTQGVYTLQTALDPSTTYYWRSYAIDPGGSDTWSSTQGTPYSFTTTNPPTAPTTPYAEGATNPSGVADTTPEFSAIHNDPDGDSANYYQVEVNTASDFTGTIMWDSTQTSMTTTADGVRSPDISYAGSALSWDTTYYWRIKFWDTFGAEGVVSATQNFTMNTGPNTPSLDSPTDTAINQSLLPALKTTGTDPNSDYLRYKIELCEDVGMSTNCQTYDQTSSQTGWSDQNAETSTAYTSGTQATYTLQSVLDTSTTYYWRSYSIDPAGTNTWSSTQGTPYSFTTTSNPVQQTNCRVQESRDDSSLNIIWTDTATNEDYYEIERSVDAAAWVDLITTLPANTTSYEDSSITTSHTYRYRIAPYLTDGPNYGDWCYTDTLSISTGNFTFENINFE